MFLPLNLDINAHSRTPVYKQVIHEISDKIEKGLLPYGEKLPSINHLSEGYQLSRNTVEKAYLQLKESGVVDAVKGKGYFVKNTRPLTRTKVMLLLHELNHYTRTIYQAAVAELDGHAELDLYIFHEDFQHFRQLITEHREAYHYLMIVPHFLDETRTKVNEVLDTIPASKLILIDRKPDYIRHYFGTVFQDYKMDLYDTLFANLEVMRKYRHLTLVYPLTGNYPRGIKDGFTRFCGFHGFDFDIIYEIDPGYQPRPHRGILTVRDHDLIALIKLVRQQGLKPGVDLGIISYNDHDLKEVLENGITVVTTDFEIMGRTAARMILDKSGKEIKNPFKMICRASY